MKKFSTILSGLCHDVGHTGRTNSFFHDECVKPEYRDEGSRYLKELEKKYKFKSKGK